MSPHDELATVKEDSKTYVFTLAQPGEEYICYVLGDGPVTITLELTGGPAGRRPADFTARWYDPKSGRFLAPAHQVQGKGRHLFQSPTFKQDIVLYVRD